MEGGFVDGAVAAFAEEGSGGEVVCGGDDVGVEEVLDSVSLCWAFGFSFVLEGVRVACGYCGIGVASEVTH